MKYEPKDGIADVSLAEQNAPPARRPVTQKVSGSLGGASGTRPDDPKKG